jgi:hypothetical protein
VSLEDYQRFTQQPNSLKGAAVIEIKMKNTDNEEKNLVQIPAFLTVEAELPAELHLWILHYADQVNGCGLGDSWEACIQYFTRFINSNVRAAYQTA